MIPKPLAWGIVVVLTALEALNVCAAIWVDGYQSDSLVHFAFTTIVGFMLGMREGSGVVSKAMAAVRGMATPTPPGAAPPDPPPPSQAQPPAAPPQTQEPP
jgi:hypothetical protein